MKFIFVFIFATVLAKTNYSQTTYTFIGNGNWTISGNWNNNMIPPNPLPNGSTIYISSQPGDSCVLNIQQTISQGAGLIVSTGANFVVPGGFIIDGPVSICNQVWMTKNLDITTYRNGDSIPHVSDSAEWANLTSGAWCYYNNDPNNRNVYGKLYNWYAVIDPRGLAPQGWHIPSDSEWTTLSTCLGGTSVAGGAMKEVGTTHWISNVGATNSSNFTALPSGFRSYVSKFDYLRFYTEFWSSSSFNIDLAWYRTVEYSSAYLKRNNTDKNYGFSVRCIKD